MRVEHIPGGLILLKPQNSQERIAVAQKIAAGTVDGGMNLHGSRKLVNEVGHWITLSGGQHILIGDHGGPKLAGPVSDEEFQKKLKPLLYIMSGKFSGKSAIASAMYASYLDRLSQEQLKKIYYAIESEDIDNSEKVAMDVVDIRLDIEAGKSFDPNEAFDKISSVDDWKKNDYSRPAIAIISSAKFGAIVSRMNDETAQTALTEAKYPLELARAMVLFGPAKAAIAADSIVKESSAPWMTPKFLTGQGDVAREDLVNAWTLAGGTTTQIRMQYIAGEMGANKDAEGLLNYTAALHGIENPVGGQPAGLVETMKNIYEKTQASMSKDPEYITLYRGVGGKTIVHSPLEAWSVESSTAVAFSKAMSGSAGSAGYVMVATVPKSAVFWSYKSEAQKSGGYWPPEGELKGKKEYTIFGGAVVGHEHAVPVSMFNAATAKAALKIKLGKK